MSFDNATFFANVPAVLEKTHKLLDTYIATFAEKASVEADCLQKYREKRSMLLKQASKEGVSATTASEYVKGDCAQEKADWMKALGEKQQLRYQINATQDRIYTIRHLSSQIEAQMKTQ
jgi:hypothetical protein